MKSSSLNKLNFALVIHNHQPVGNADQIIERIYRRSYLPFLKRLAAHPEISVNLHYTGFLLEWLEKKHPEFIKLLQDIVSRGQA
ncbi:MAG: 4-alpha-glucanotransferase, partial [Rhabdochlamydiaceae bacterium]